MGETTFLWPMGQSFQTGSIVYNASGSRILCIASYAFLCGSKTENLQTKDILSNSNQFLM